MVERLRGRRAVVQRRKRMMRTDGLCEICEANGFLIHATVVDHIVPLAKGGSDDDSNTRNLCDPCHQRVTAQQFGYREPTTGRGVGADGRPTSPDHPWNRR